MIRSGRQRRADFKKIVERDPSLEGIGLAFDGKNIRLLDTKLGGILDDNDALVVRNCLGQYSRRVVFPLPVPPLIRTVFPQRICSVKEVRERLGQRAASDQVIDREIGGW